jgi:ATP-dependent DNA ligase
LPRRWPNGNELKFDGYRAIGMKASGRVRLFSRNGNDFTRRFAAIARALEALPDETVIDGEIIAYDAEGRPSFNVLQNLSGTDRCQSLAIDAIARLPRRPMTVEGAEKRGLLGP